MKNNKPMKKRPRESFSIGNVLLLLVLIGMVLGIFFSFDGDGKTTHDYSYTEFSQELKAGNINTISATPVDGENNKEITQLTGELTNGDRYTVLIPTIESYNAVLDLALEANIKITQVPLSTFNLLQIIITFLPFLLIGFMILSMLKSSSGGNNKAFEFSKSRARLQVDKSATFKDVAGLEEEKDEMIELVDFLKNPSKYSQLGARIPKGVLLVGPPGTGKTLLAKAVAGEANVPFFTISGSDFVEMFVGVGASRVRDMFKEAKKNAPCIVFIDEIDAVGRQRGAGMGGGNDEREQTLNQLLVEMDGFGTNLGIIVVAATNRPDVLDPALLRPGRFDRQIMINTPDLRGRTAILGVHARNKKIASSVKLEDISRRTPGFSGAELENVLNEAALLVARDNRKEITIQDIDEAVDRVMMGPAKKSMKFNEHERNVVAHHEAGHVVIGLKLENAEIVHKVTIIPRGNAGGYALMLPEQETFLKTKQSLLDTITGYFGGRASEEINFNDVSTGARDDFERSTKIARAMVTQYGMSSLGPVSYEQSGGSVFLGRDYNKTKDFSEDVANDIDLAVKEILDSCYSRAKKVLTEHLDLVKLIAKYLLEIETLTREDIYEIEETGKLKWWDEKVLAEKSEKANQDNEVETIEENVEVFTEEAPKTEE